MPIDHLAPPQAVLADRRRDPDDPRALDVWAPWTKQGLPDHGLVGIPFDGAVLGRKGAAEGPQGIREALRFYSSYRWEDERELADASSGDVGDVICVDDVGQTHSRVRSVIAALLAGECYPYVIGGDNSVTWATVAGVLDATEGPVGILDLDAHLDVRQSLPEASSGTPYRRIIEDFPTRVAAANISQIGHRHFTNSRVHRQWAADHGVGVWDMDAVREQGMQSVLEEAVAAAGDGTEHLILSLDMDVVDQAHAPGVSAPTPAGLNPMAMLEAVRKMAGESRCRLFEIVEVAPPLDPSGNTARLAALAVMEHLASY